MDVRLGAKATFDGTPFTPVYPKQLTWREMLELIVWANSEPFTTPEEKPSTGPIVEGRSSLECNRLRAAYLLERRQVAGAVPNAFLKAREKAASEP